MSNVYVPQPPSRRMSLSGGVWTVDPIPISAGGTGATTAPEARTNLGITGVGVGSVLIVSSAFNVGAYTTYIMNAASGEVIGTLPDCATYNGSIFYFVRTVETRFNAIVVCSGNNTFTDGRKSRFLSSTGETLVVQSTGSAWLCLGN